MTISTHLAAPALLVALFLAPACGAGTASGQDGGLPDGDAGASDAGPDDGGTDSGPGDGGDGGSDCPLGVICVDTLPFHDENDTGLSTARDLDGYGCAPGTDESGPERIYRVRLPTAGFFSAAVHDGAGVDVDLHLLASLDAADCLDRGDLSVAADLEAGFVYVVADTYVSGGVEHAGPYGLDLGLLVPSEGDCGLEVGTMARVNDGGNTLAMPATGPIVREAHLVTAEEPEPYPSAAREFIERHYALSQETTGLVMHRLESWAPLEGGSFYGAGIGSPTLLPVLEEGWYVNMYWQVSDRPARGTRMILRLPGTDRAVVVAAGHETGPGNLAHIGGTPEETHFYLGTSHLDVLTLGIAVDQSLPFGPRRCTGP
ncbi:MAG: hypothetical protein P1V51_12630 [Deltaproteobacteria bacterium]|nr:hypothetical protein [Deltaproteobacteria bacterium]